MSGEEVVEECMALDRRGVCSFLLTSERRESDNSREVNQVGSRGDRR